MRMKKSGPTWWGWTFLFVILCFATFYYIFRLDVEAFTLYEDNKEMSISPNYNSQKVLQKMKKYSVIIGGTCRNNEKHIGQILDNIEKCGKKFKKFTVILYENDSTDKTREILLSKKKDNYIYILEDGIKEERRTKRLERGRNKILDTIRNINTDNQYQYFINMDLDNVNYEGTFIHTIESCFVEDEDKWDAQFGNQKDAYYDIWALRKENYFNEDFVLSQKSEEIINDRPNLPDGKLISVNSAFGGISVYKLSSIPAHCKYVGAYSSGHEKCEHVEFNECIKNNGGKLFINTSFINDG